MSLYRQYRPQNFSELLGQEEVTETLRAQLSSGKFAQAYLFTGPKGTGKTTTARIVAKVLNCDHPKGGEPDERCPSCIAIAAGTNLDVIEIDAASNRGIEEVRDLREKIKLAPTQGKFKVYIIDEAQMLTMEAFNALLKTLEEPPAHAVFILCTTEAHKIPATVLSRCQKFEFGKASASQLEALVKKIAKKEEINLDVEAVTAIVSASDGSFRDSLTLLDQVRSTGAVTAEKVRRLTKRSGEVERLLKLLEEENAVAAIEMVEELGQLGFNMSTLTAQVIDSLKGELLLAVRDQNPTKQVQLTKLIRLFSTAYKDLKFAPIPVLPVELAIVEAVGTQEQIVKEVVAEVMADAAAGESKDAAMKQAPEVEPSAGLEDLKAQWEKVLAAIKPFNHSLEAFMRGCEPYQVEGKIVTLKFFYKFHKDMVDQAKNRELVERELGKIVGKEVRVKTVLGEKAAAKKIKVEEVANVEEVADDDLIQKAVEIFNSGIS